MDRSSELTKLEDISRDSVYALGANRTMIEYCYRIVSRLFPRPGSVLEMGPADGVMTSRLVDLAGQLSVVEASKTYCSSIEARLPTVKVHCALFEEFEPDCKYDLIILGHVLEHVEDPVALLRRVQAWLAPGGSIFSAVPNARSIHRQAAVLMGLLSQESQLNDMDRRHGHRRVMDPEGFRACFHHAGLHIDHFGGYWLKPVSSGQIESTWTNEMLDAFMRLGERYPDIAGELYIVARSHAETDAACNPAHPVLE